jgi:hypothetical protein
VTVAVLGPLLVRGGIALRGDMVFTPDQPFKAGWLGLDGSVPRAVPMDALVSIVDNVLPGSVLQRLLLIVAFAAGGLGIARLARWASAPAQVAAVIVYLWNPWVYERLAIGQWPTVLGYGLLPWLVLAAVRVRDGRAQGWPAVTVLLLATAVCAPSVGLVGVLVAVCVVAAGGARRVLALLGVAVVTNLPWIVPAVLGPGLHSSDAQFGDFAARGESSLGVLASLLSMGGIWKSSVIPPERTHVLVVAAAALLALAFVVGLAYAAPAIGRRTTTGIAIAGGVALLLALLPAIGPVGDGLGTISAHVPALGILRDSQRYLAPLGLVLALGAAAVVDRLIAAERAGRSGSAGIAGLVVLAPVLLLPSLTWGLAGKIRPVDYPGDWDRVASLLGAPGGAQKGATVVLPWTGSYRGYAWNDDRALLDPAPRFLPGDVLDDDRTYLRTSVLPSEDPYLTKIGTALRTPDPAGALRGLGVRWVLVEKANGVTASQVPTGTTAYDGHWLRLVDLGAPTRSIADVRKSPAAGGVIVADGLAGFALIVSVWSLTRVSGRKRSINV